MKKILAAILVSMILLAVPTSVFAFWCPPPGPGPGPGPGPLCPALGVSINGIGGVVYNFTELEDGKCTYFTVEVSVWNMTDLYGYQFNLTWGTTYFEFVSVDYETYADDMYPAGWFKVLPPSDYDGSPPYAQAISAQGGEGFDGDHILAVLTFHMKDDICWLQQDDRGWFEISYSKFVDSCSVEIKLCNTYNIAWQYIAVQPKIYITPTKVLNCRVWNGANCTDPDTFTLTVNIANITKMASLHFDLRWNKFHLVSPWEDLYTLLINYTKVTVNTDIFPTDKFTWTVTPYTQPTYMGLVFSLVNKTALTYCQLIRGNFWAVKIDFKKCDPWLANRQPEYIKTATCWNTENATTDIWFDDWSNYIDVYCPVYGRIYFGLPVPDVYPYAIDVGSKFTLDPIVGDLDGDGDVDLTDLMIIANYYHSAWILPNAYYDLNNDGVIDIGDVVIVAKEYGKECGL